MEIVVYQPEIAGNVGAIIRLSANSGIPVNFIKPFGFNMQENKLRRAGLDYQDLAFVKIMKVGLILLIVIKINLLHVSALKETKSTGTKN